jgi:hypothetical protein
MTRAGVDIVNSLVTGPTDYIVPNIGQSQHEATLIFRDAPGQTCTGGVIEIFFEGTPDRAITPIPKGIPAGSTLTFGSIIYARVRADTSLPQVRLNIASFDNTNCSISAYYAGTQYPFAFQNFIPEFVLTGLNIINVQAALAGDNELVAASAGGLRICVYEILLYNTGTQDVTITSDPTAANTLDGPFTTLPAFATYSLENGGQVHYCTNGGESLNLILSVGVGSPMNGHLVFRYEP